MEFEEYFIKKNSQFNFQKCEWNRSQSAACSYRASYNTAHLWASTFSHPQLQVRWQVLKPKGEVTIMQTATLTVPYLFYDERVEADLVDALLEAVRLVHVHHLAVQMQQLQVAQLRTKDLIVKLLWGKKFYTFSLTHLYNRLQQGPHCMSKNS